MTPRRSNSAGAVEAPVTVRADDRVEAPAGPERTPRALAPAAPRRAARTYPAGGAGPPGPSSFAPACGGGSGPSSPVTAVPEPAPGSATAAVTGQTPLSGQAGLDAWKRAQSAHNAAKRRGRTKRAAKPLGPGMIRRLPPEPPGGAA